MLTVNLSDGKTVSFDLSKVGDAERLIAFEREHGHEITVVTVVRDGVTYSCVNPATGRPVSVEVEETERGERVRLFADDLTLSMMVHARHRAVRVTVERGRRVWRPEVSDVVRHRR